MASQSKISSIKSELLSLENIINYFLQWQMQLKVQLDALEPSWHDEPCCLEPLNNYWADVVKGKSWISLPLFDPRGNINILPLSNSFAPLAELAGSLT